MDARAPARPARRPAICRCATGQPLAQRRGVPAEESMGRLVVRTFVVAARPILLAITRLVSCVVAFLQVCIWPPAGRVSRGPGLAVDAPRTASSYAGPHAVDDGAPYRTAPVRPAPCHRRIERAGVAAWAAGGPRARNGRIDVAVALVRPPRGRTRERRRRSAARGRLPARARHLARRSPAGGGAAPGRVVRTRAGQHVSSGLRDSVTNDIEVARSGGRP